MAYLDYSGLAYFKSLLDESYLRTDHEGDTVINGNVTFTEPVNASVKNDWLGQQIDKTYIKDLRPEDDGEVALIYGDNHEKVITVDTAVTQVRSDANEMYPILLCYDANAEVNQVSKSVRYGHNVAINPAYGYVYANSYVVKHPTYNRTVSSTTRVEWASDFRDSVLNPVGQVFEYIDPVSSGGEHRMEFRLYGNPNVAGINTPNVNDETNTISMGVSVTRGDTLTFFGYCPSTPIYLEDSSTMRKSLTRGDQYGRDIITRDWLNLNGSITGLVHIYMDEAIDGSKTFKKTVTINSGDNNNKAGLYVQGNSDIHGNEHVYGTEIVDGKLTANGTAEIKGGSGNNPSLLVTGNETVTGKLTGTGTVEFSGGNGNTPTLIVNGNESISGNSNVGGNSSVAGNETVSGKITGNNGAEINGGNGLVVNGNETVNGEIYKIINNTPQEYVSYVTNKQETKTTIVNNLIKDKGGLAVDANKNIYVSLRNGGGIVNDNGYLRVDFSVNDGDAAAQELLNQTKNAILSSLNIQIPILSNKNFYVNKDSASATDAWRNAYGVIDSTVGTSSKPFKSISAAIACATQGYSLGAYHIDIRVVKGSTPYQEKLVLSPFLCTTGYIKIVSDDDRNMTVINNLSNQTLIDANGSGTWYLENLELHTSCGPINNGIHNYVNLVTTRNNSTLNILGCACYMSYSGDATSNGTVSMQMFQADTGAHLYFRYLANNQTSVSINKGNSNRCVCFTSQRQGYISFIGDSLPESSALEYTIPCSGSCDILLECWQQSTLNILSGHAHDFKLVGTITGKKCEAGTASIIVFGYDVPGSIAGTVDSSSYAFVSPSSLLSV